MKNFDSAVAASLSFEIGPRFNPTLQGCIDGTDPLACGVNNVRGDTGGYTKYGIAQNKHPNVNVPKLILAEAIEIYRAFYWNLVYGDQTAAASNSEIAAYVFDMSVNMGVHAAVRTLQRSLKIKPDGWYGKQTLAAVSSATIDNLVVARLDFYKSLGEQNPDDIRFVQGWNTRARTYNSQFQKYSR